MTNVIMIVALNFLVPGISSGFLNRTVLNYAGAPTLDNELTVSKERYGVSICSSIRLLFSIIFILGANNLAFVDVHCPSFFHFPCLFFSLASLFPMPFHFSCFFISPAYSFLLLVHFSCLFISLASLFPMPLHFSCLFISHACAFLILLHFWFVMQV